MATAKKVVKKKATVKKVTAKKSAPRRAKKTQMKSFKVSNEAGPFVSFKVTDQTVYWSILLLLILLLFLWVLSIQVNISDLLNSMKIAI